MKTFRYHIALLVVILMAIATNVQAQDDERALGAAADTIIRTETRDYIVNRIVENVYQSHPTASLATRLAKAYYNFNEEEGYKDKFHKIRHFHKNDTTHAFMYIRRAIELDPKYAPAYVLASDIVDYDGNTEEAQNWLKKGINEAPKDSSLYVASASILARDDVEAAIVQLQHLKEIDPNFPIDLHVARIYNKIDVRGVDYLDKVVEFYRKANVNDMTVGDLGTFVNALYWTNDLDKCYEVASLGVGKFPNDFALNRFCARSLLGLKRYAESVTASVVFLALNTDIPFDNWDYIYYGDALKGSKQYDAALEQFEKVLAKDNLSDRDKTALNDRVASCVSAKIMDIAKNGEYDEAIRQYEKFMAEREAAGKMTDIIRSNYANIYLEWAQELNGQDKIDKMMKADQILDNAIRNIQVKDNAIAFAYKRIVTIGFQIDKNAESGYVMPAITQLESLLESSGETELDGSKRGLMVTGYRYALGYYFSSKNDRKTALEYAYKILALDPTNEAANQVKNLVEKYGSR